MKKLEPLLEKLSNGYVDKEALSDDLDVFLQAAIAAICHCYDNEGGMFPTNCDCEDRERISESISMLLDIYKKIKNRHAL